MTSKKRDAIIESLLKLLDERPLSKISVKDIVEDCGINRNTFYYHFQDMPALIEAMAMEELNRVMRQYSDISSIEECFSAVMRLSMAHRRAVYHIYNSANRDILERYMLEICEYAVAKYVDGAARGCDLSPEDRDIIIRGGKCACFGLAVDWLNEGMRGDAQAHIARLCELYGGTMERAIQRSAQRRDDFA